MLQVNISAPHSFARWRSSKLLSAGGQRGAGAVVRDSHALTGLDVNSTYVIKIRARNSFGDGQWTPEFRFRTSNGECERAVPHSPPRRAPVCRNTRAGRTAKRPWVDNTAGVFGGRWGAEMCKYDGSGKKKRR